MSLLPYSEIAERFLELPDVCVFNDGSHRAVLWDWHVHSFAMHGQLCGYGKSLEEACQRLLASADDPGAMVVHGSCDWQCEQKYSISPAYEISRKQFGQFLLKVSNNKKKGK
jgi:hypothetical protein